MQRLRRLQTSPLTDTRPPPSAYPLSPNETHLGGSVHLPPLHGYVSRLGMCTSPDNNSTDESNPKHHGSPGSEVTVRGPRLEMHLTILGGPPPTQKTTNNRDSYSSNDSGFSASFASSTTSPTHPGTNRVSPKLPPINGIPESENRLPLDEFPESLTLAPMRGEPNLPAQLSGPAALLSPSRDVHEPKASYREVETHYRSPRTMAGRRTPRMPTMRCRINKQFDTGFRHPGHAYLPPSGHKVKRRGNLPKPVTEKLKAWFTDHIGHPYPSEDEKQILMAQTRLSLSQVSPPGWDLRTVADRNVDQQLVYQCPAAQVAQTEQGGRSRGETETPTIRGRCPDRRTIGRDVRGRIRGPIRLMQIRVVSRSSL